MFERRRVIRAPQSAGRGAPDLGSGPEQQPAVLARSNKQALSAMAAASRRARDGAEPTDAASPIAQFRVEPPSSSAWSMSADDARHETITAPVEHPYERDLPHERTLPATALPSFSTYLRERIGSARLRWRSAGGSPKENAYRRGIVAIGAVVVVLSVVVVALNLSGGSSTGPSATSSVGQGTATRSTRPSTPSHSTNPTTPTTSGGRSSGSSTTSPPPPPAASGGPPVLASLSSTSGSAGQSIAISGSGFLSPDGHVQAYFGQVEAPTSCPNQSTCNVTVPPQAAGAPTTVSVTVTTASGTSNSLSFSYS